MSAAMTRATPLPSDDDDAALVAQVREGNDRAFSVLFRRHARVVAGMACRLVGDEGEIDDIVQETFTIASRRLASLRDPAAFRPWLLGIAIQRVRRCLGRRRRRRWLTGEVTRTLPQVSDPRELHEVAALYDALDQLAGELRVPWVLHVIQGETLPDVARMCDVSLATAKRRIQRAEAKLRRRLDDV
jgi:RNA polymerase sigma-70 factor (ECF subfamily)